MIIEIDTLMTQARDEAKRYHHKYIRTEHVLLAMFQQVEVTEYGIEADCIRSGVAMMNCPTCSAEEQMILSAGAERAMQLAQDYAGQQPLMTSHLMLGILNSSITCGRLLASCGVDVTLLVTDIESKIQHGE